MKSCLFNLVFVFFLVFADGKELTDVRRMEVLRRQTNGKWKDTEERENNSAISLLELQNLDLVNINSKINKWEE